MGITAAIRLAIEEATAVEMNAGEALALKIEPIVSKLRGLKREDARDDKEFMDEMWGERG